MNFVLAKIPVWAIATVNLDIEKVLLKPRTVYSLKFSHKEYYPVVPAVVGTTRKFRYDRF